MSFAFITSDVKKILNEIGNTVILRKVNKTMDSSGNTTSKTYTDTTITGYIHPVVYDDTTLLKQGFTPSQEAVGLFIDTTIESHDLILDGNTTYEVIDILSKTKLKGETLFTRCRLRRI